MRNVFILKENPLKLQSNLLYLFNKTGKYKINLKTNFFYLEAINCCDQSHVI